MWTDTKNGFTATLMTRQKEEVTVEINRPKQLAFVCGSVCDRVICGVRDNKVKIWNDQIFDPGTTNLIKAKMEATVLKKPKDPRKGR